ncbi:MAG: ComEA family DNA-binding protein, partial [Campylobacteraceae bacterium]|nr:ComEA family DNA-binding protein [Campylobacteraceae bacterium]
MFRLFVLFCVLGVALWAAVNINTANVEELATLKGIGEKKAQAIIEYREANGGFKTVDELSNVKGIGEKIVAK